MAVIILSVDSVYMFGVELERFLGIVTSLD